jgi:hypothetical protein
MELATKAHTVDALQAVGIDRAWLIPPSRGVRTGS